MCKAVIIDDELDAIQSVKLLLNQYFPECEVVGTAQNAKDGKEVILETKPKIVFLDIEMPKGTGFDLLESLPSRDFKVVFITAYNQYAIKAFRYSAIDYILKPIDIDEFSSVVKKLKEVCGQDTPALESQLEVLLNNMKTESPKKIALSTSEGLEFVSIDNIVQIQAEGSYSVLKLIDQTELIASRNLGEFESILEENNFYRAHQSHLINLKHVRKVTRLGNELLMDDGSVAFISRRKKAHFLELMATMAKQLKA